MVRPYLCSCNKSEWVKVKLPDKHIVTSKTDVSDAFRNVRMATEHALKICYAIHEMMAADMRLTVGWAGSPGFWGITSSAAELSHCNTCLLNVELLKKGRK